MYLIKVVTRVNKENAIEMESNYCCQRYHVIPHRETTHLETFKMEEPDTEFTVDKKKARSVVYVMNESGKTIDTYRWA